MEGGGVFQQEYRKTTELISTKLGRRMGPGPRKNPLDSEAEPEIFSLLSLTTLLQDKDYLEN